MSKNKEIKTETKKDMTAGDNTAAEGVDKKGKKKVSKKAKAAIIIVAVVAVIAVIIALIAANKNTIINNTMGYLLPDQIDFSEYDTEEERDLIVYKERNKEYDPKKDKAEPLKKYNYYYYDDNGNKVTLRYDEPLFEGTEDEELACTTFYAEAINKLPTVVSVLKAVIAVIVIAVVIAAIVIWYILWSRNYDKEKENAFKNKKHAAKKKR